MLLRTTLLAAAALGMSACATGETNTAEMPGDRDCFRTASVTGYGIIDDHNIRVTAGANRRYILSTVWNANDLDWTNALVLRSPTGWVCTGRSPGVEVTGGHFAHTFPINSVSREPTDEPVGS